jgi:hypothetical protein
VAAFRTILAGVLHETAVFQRAVFAVPACRAVAVDGIVRLRYACTSVLAVFAERALRPDSQHAILALPVPRPRHVVAVWGRPFRVVLVAPRYAALTAAQHARAISPTVIDGHGGGVARRQLALRAAVQNSAVAGVAGIVVHASAVRCAVVVVLARRFRTVFPSPLADASACEIESIVGTGASVLTGAAGARLRAAGAEAVEVAGAIVSMVIRPFATRNEA